MKKKLYVVEWEGDIYSCQPLLETAKTIRNRCGETAKIMIYEEIKEWVKE